MTMEPPRPEPEIEPEPGFELETESVPPDQAWFHTPEWQAGEREAQEQLARGEGTFHENDEDFLASFAADTITIPSDPETERALALLTADGISRQSAIKRAVLEQATRRNQATEKRRAVLQMPLGDHDGINIAKELSRDRDRAL